MYKSTSRQITKNVVINYLHNLNSARILFALNYSKKNNNQSVENSEVQTSSGGNHMVSTTEFPLLKA